MANNNIVDKYLQFVQSNFNTTDVSVREIARVLDMLSKQLGVNEKRDKEKLDRLKSNIGDLNVIQDTELYSRFEELTDSIDIDRTSKVFVVAQKLIFDLENTREWLTEYEKVINSLTLNSMEQLIILGKSILARAVELCPYRTGNLRSSGTLIVYKDYIVIAFQAPYATYVHEDLETSFKYGRAKFLEVALQEFLPNTKTWVEVLGETMVYAKITINKEVTYKHWGK